MDVIDAIIYFTDRAGTACAAVLRRGCWAIHELRGWQYVRVYSPEGRGA